MPKIEYYETLCTEIVQRLKKERERKKITKYVIWQRSGISQSMLGRVERGLRRPTLELMLRFADAIDVDFGKLITRSVAKVKKATPTGLAGSGKK